MRERKSGRFQWRNRGGKVWRGRRSPRWGYIKWFTSYFHHHYCNRCTMRINGFFWPSQLIPSYRFSHILRPHRCRIHRTICHHARRPALRVVGASAPAHVESRRGAKKQSTVKLKDIPLPQGALKLESYNDGTDEDAPRYPTVVQGHRNNMQKFRNCVVLTRIGGFYEVRHCVLLACLCCAGS